MTREEFIEILENKNYSYEIESDKLIVTHLGNVLLDFLNDLPSDIVFKNTGVLNLENLKELQSGISFENEGGVWLGSLLSLPPDVKFKNDGVISLKSLTGLPPYVRFDHATDVHLKFLTRGWFNDWKGNIGRIRGPRLLNLMIKQEVFI